MAEKKRNENPENEKAGGFSLKNEHPCAGCLHFYGRYHNNKCCNYLFDVGHVRPCPPGEGCTVKHPIQSEEDLKIRKRWNVGKEKTEAE